MTATEKKGNWYKVAYTYKTKGVNITKKGWVSGSFLKEYYQYSTITNSYFITNKEAKLYQSPDTKKKEVLTVESDTQFKASQKVVNPKKKRGNLVHLVSFENKNLYINSM